MHRGQRTQEWERERRGQGREGEQRKEEGVVEEVQVQEEESCTVDSVAGAVAGAVWVVTGAGSLDFLRADC